MADEEKLTRHQILLVPGDFAKIRSVYGNQTSAIIRALVRNFVREKIEAKSE
jgi:transposase